MRARAARGRRRARPQCGTVVMLASRECGAVDRQGMTAVYLAAWSNNDQALRILLHRAASFNTPSNTSSRSAFRLNFIGCRGDTPLMVAATYGHAAAVAVLLQAGADPTIVDADGLNALELACKVRGDRIWHSLV